MVPVITCVCRKHSRRDRLEDHFYFSRLVSLISCESDVIAWAGHTSAVTVAIFAPHVGDAPPRKETIIVAADHTGLIQVYYNAHV